MTSLDLQVYLQVKLLTQSQSLLQGRYGYGSTAEKNNVYSVAQRGLSHDMFRTGLLKIQAYYYIFLKMGNYLRLGIILTNFQIQ